MAKQVKRVTVAYHWDSRLSVKYPSATIPAYLTATAGLCVGHTHRLKVNHKDKTQELVKLPTWDVITYPSGHSVVQGFPTKAQAVEAAELELKDFSWVCMFFADFEKNNNMDDVRRKIMQIREAYHLRSTL